MPLTLNAHYFNNQMMTIYITSANKTPDSMHIITWHTQLNHQKGKVQVFHSKLYLSLRRNIGIRITMKFYH